MNGKIMHVAEGGTQTDVTEGVQTLYDLVIGSMDWGSGFLSYEDAIPVVEIARLCGFKQAEEAERYVNDSLHERESETWRRTLDFRANSIANGQRVPHDHVWSSVGKCMWTFCRARQGATGRPYPG